MDEHTPERKCPECKGKCCRAVDYGYRVEHMGSELYMHSCDSCYDGKAPERDPRDAELAKLREAIAAWPEIGHGERCDVYVFCHPPLECDCGADDANEARAHARRVAGLEEP